MKGKRLYVLFLFCCTIFTPMVIHAAQDERAALSERASTYWAANLKGDVETLYSYLSPDEKSLVTLEQFSSGRKSRDEIKYHACKVLETQISGSDGWVQVECEFSLKKYPAIPQKVSKNWTLWTKEEGSWYPVARNSNKVPPSPPSMRSAEEEQRLTKRADGYWRAVEKQDWAAMYPFLHPAYRAQVPLDEFLKKQAMNVYLSHQIAWAQVLQSRPDQGTVRVVYGYRLNDPSLSKLPPEEKSISELWAKVDGEWYRNIDPNSEKE